MIRNIRDFHITRVQIRWASIASEQTPNPESTLFWVNHGSDILGKGARSLSFESRYSCQDSPLASALFKITGVNSVLLGPNSITVTKKPDFDWKVVKPSVELVLSQFIDSGIPVVRPGAIQFDHTKNSQPETDSESVEQKIRALIVERVQPFVAQDGGDIEFMSFDSKSGVVKVRMHGACKGCPKSMITLKMGIERMLKHYIPDVVGVVNVDDEDMPQDKEKVKEFGP